MRIWRLLAICSMLLACTLPYAANAQGVFQGEDRNRGHWADLCAVLVSGPPETVSERLELALRDEGLWEYMHFLAAYSARNCDTPTGKSNGMPFTWRVMELDLIEEFYFDYFFQIDQSGLNINGHPISFDPVRSIDLADKRTKTHLDFIDELLAGGGLSQSHQADLRQLRQELVARYNAKTGEQVWQQRIAEGSTGYAASFENFSFLICEMLDLNFGYRDAGVKVERSFLSMLAIDDSNTGYVANTSWPTPLPAHAVDLQRFWNAHSAHFVCPQGSTIVPHATVPRHFLKRVVDMGMENQVFWEFLLSDSEEFPIDVNAVERVNGRPETLLDYVELRIADPDPLYCDTRYEGRIPYTHCDPATRRRVLDALEELRETLIDEYGGLTAAQLGS